MRASEGEEGKCSEHRGGGTEPCKVVHLHLCGAIHGSLGGSIYLLVLVDSFCLDIM